MPQVEFNDIEPIQIVVFKLKRSLIKPHLFWIEPIQIVVFK